MFSFPPLPEGDTSTDNWYQDLLDDANCQGDMARVQEAYEVHRTNAASKAVSTYLTSLADHSPANPIPRPDEALIAHLQRQSSSSSPSTDDLSEQDVNCAVVWARPSTAVLDTLLGVQKRIAEYWDSDFQLIPPSHIHLSVIELSHKHSVAHLRSVLDKVGKERLRSMIALPAHGEHKSFPRLIRPQLMFDAGGVAVCFVPHADDSWSYHHLRADMQKIAKGSSIDIDTCYTAATAHVTVGRFIGSGKELVEKVGREKVIGNWLDLVEELNTELKEAELIWEVGKEKGLEIQAGYVKFGRGSEMAEQL